LWLLQLNAPLTRFVTILLMSAYHIPVEMYRTGPVFARMKSFALTAHLALIYKKKCMKTWRPTSALIQASGAGEGKALIRTIDHRRVPNLMVFFTRKGESLPITNRADDYSPGELVTWDLGGGVTHIGIVVDRKGFFTRRYMIEHNIGAGPKIEDVLFDWKITGHYRYFGP
jgi:hypothetical protein